MPSSRSSSFTARLNWVQVLPRPSLARKSIAVDLEPLASIDEPEENLDVLWLHQGVRFIWHHLAQSATMKELLLEEMAYIYTLFVIIKQS